MGELQARQVKTSKHWFGMFFFLAVCAPSPLCPQKTSHPQKTPKPIRNTVLGTTVTYPLYQPSTFESMMFPTSRLGEDMAWFPSCFHPGDF